MPDGLPPYRTFLLSDTAIREVLRDARVVAMVGLAPDGPEAALADARHLKQHGYRVIPVHPGGAPVLGVPAAPSLRDVGEAIDVVDVWSPPAGVGALAAEAVEVGARVLWLEPSAADPAAAYAAHRSGLLVVMNRRLRAEHDMHFPPDELGP